jgi:hypothetical protein
VTVRRIRWLGPLLAVLIGLGLQFGAAVPAAAYTGLHLRTKPIGAFTVGVKGANIKIPKGCFLTIGVNYRHHSFADHNRPAIKTARVGTDCVGWHGMNPWRFCNRKVSISWYTDTGRRYYRWTSSTAHDCRSNNLWTQPTSVYGFYGKACARFYVSGKQVRRVCIPIHG